MEFTLCLEQDRGFAHRVLGPSGLIALSNQNIGLYPLKVTTSDGDGSIKVSVYVCVYVYIYIHVVQLSVCATPATLRTYSLPEALMTQKTVVWGL